MMFDVVLICGVCSCYVLLIGVVFVCLFFVFFLGCGGEILDGSDDEDDVLGFVFLNLRKDVVGVNG